MIVPPMGMKASRKSRPPAPPASTGLADVLFTPVQQRVLGLLFGQPERRFQSAEVIRLAGSGTGAAHRLLTRLAAAGLVTTERVGNQKHYQANAGSPVFAELIGLIRKTAGFAMKRGINKVRTVPGHARATNPKAIRRKLESRGITEKDVADAVRWARKRRRRKGAASNPSAANPPVEIYSDARVREFDAGESELKKLLRRP
jgi:hypothetical protein